MEEIESVFKDLSMSSAPGIDQITFGDGKTIDPELLLVLFNNILKEQCIPEQWKTVRTTLIIKAGKEYSANEIGSWRPISVTDTSYRIFTSIHEGNLIIALHVPDGCAMHNAVLTAMNEKFMVLARNRRRNR